MKNFVLLGALLALAGCVSQSEVALSSNVVRLDVDARGLIGVNAAKEGMEKRISMTVRSRGYTHYKILDYGSQRGSEYAGSMPVYANTSVNVYGNTAYGSTTYSGGQAINVPVSQTSIIVAMFKAPNIPADAIEAK